MKYSKKERLKKEIKGIVKVLRLKGIEKKELESQVANNKSIYRYELLEQEIDQLKENSTIYRRKLRKHMTLEFENHTIEIMEIGRKKKYKLRKIIIGVGMKKKYRLVDTFKKLDNLIDYLSKKLDIKKVYIKNTIKEFENGR